MPVVLVMVVRNPTLVVVVLDPRAVVILEFVEIPGVVVPDAVLNRLAAFRNPADQAKVGAEIAAEQIRWIVREGWAGVYLISPGAVSEVCNVLRAGLR